MMEPELILDARTELGEGPAWDAAKGQLTWVDIYAGRLHIYDPLSKTDQAYQLDAALGFSAPCNPDWKSPDGLGGDTLLGLRSGLALFDRGNNAREVLAQPELHLPGNRFNDGKCDPAGRLLAGTMDNAEVEASGSLYSYSPDGTLKTLLTGVRISNGLTWSPDGKTFYYIDTSTRQVMAYDYDLAAGTITNPRVAVYVPAELGWPDGMTSDMEGKLWVAMWGGAKLTRWDPGTGKLIESIPIPAWNVSVCVFGGQDRTDLYVTSARKGMSAAQLVDYPHSGGLFRLRTKIIGLPTFRFGG